MFRKTVVHISVLLCVSAVVHENAWSQQSAQNLLNFTYSPNTFTSSVIRQGFDPANANHSLDPVFTNSLSVGATAIVSASNGLAIGDQAKVSVGALGGTAVGAAALAGVSGATAVGANTNVTGTNGVALGAGAVAGAADGGWAGMTIGGVTISGNTLDANAVVSISGNGINRQIQGLADGAVTASSTDAVNGSQLYKTIQALSSQSSSGGSFPVAGDNPKNMAAPTVAIGTNGLALGSGATATGQNSVVLGNGSSDGGRANVVSVGTPAQSRQIVNVGAGTAANDAVNLSQLQPLVEALGGGAAVDSVTGTVTTPSYTIGGASYRDVGSALGATNNRIDQISTSVRSLMSTVAEQQKEYRQGIASTAAIANLPFGTTPGKVSAAAAFGSFQGEAALAVGIQSNLTDNARKKIRATASLVPDSNNVTFGAGFGMEF